MACRTAFPFPVVHVADSVLFFSLKIGCNSSVLGASRGINILSHCFVFKIWLPHDRQPKMLSKTGQETEENREDGKQKGSFQGN